MKNLVAIGPTLVSSSIQYGIQNISNSVSEGIYLKSQIKAIDLEVSQKNYEINVAQNLYQEIIRVTSKKNELIKSEVEQNKKKLDYKLNILENVEKNATNEQYIDLLIKISDFN